MMNVRVISGFAIIAIGVLFLLRNMGLLGNFELWKLWPMILIFVGIGHLSRPIQFHKFLHFLVFSGIGAIFLLKNLKILDIPFNHIWPVVLILTGATFIIFAITGKKHNKLSNGVMDLNVMFGGGAYQNPVDDFEGGRISAIMGGIELDLRKTKMKEKESTLEVFAMFGGISIRVPEDWQVIIQGSPILGGMENKTFFRASEEKSSKLIITGFATMGGVEVKN